MFRFLNSTPARVVTILLVLQGALLYSSIRPEAVAPGRPLQDFPRTLGSWDFVQDGVVDKETRDVLQADDILNRQYHRGPIPAGIFVAAFQSQRTGKSPHSPKNCLPGAGWTPLSDSKVTIDVGQGVGHDAPITVNRYIIASGEQRSLVLYWYQSRDRAVAGEFEAKFWVMADAIRYNRTDTALVRVIVPVIDKDEDLAERQATDFVQSFYPTLRQHLPS
jgi:EpsI family protein